MVLPFRSGFGRKTERKLFLQEGGACCQRTIGNVAGSLSLGKLDLVSVEHQRTKWIC